MKSRFDRQFTAIIKRSGKWFVALCPELDIVSQGKTVEQARKNITEAIELFLQTANPSEIGQHTHKETYFVALTVCYSVIGKSSQLAISIG